jgi:hypothetical protein
VLDTYKSQTSKNSKKKWFQSDRERSNATLEGRTQELKNPHPKETLAWLSWIVARLGGWSGYTSRGYKPPGPKTIARGLTRFDAIIQGWQLRSGDV